MAGDDDEALHEFVSARYRDLRRSAFLMCGDWTQAAQMTEATLARYLAESARTPIEDPDAYVYADLMAAFQHRRARREHVFVAPPESDADPVRTILVLDALHRLAPRCRAVIVLRHADGFAVDETADILGLTDDRVEAYERAGLTALDNLLTDITLTTVLDDAERPAEPHHDDRPGEPLPDEHSGEAARAERLDGVGGAEWAGHDERLGEPGNDRLDGAGHDERLEEAGSDERPGEAGRAERPAEPHHDDRPGSGAGAGAVAA